MSHIEQYKTFIRLFSWRDRSDPSPFGGGALRKHRCGSKKPKHFRSKIWLKGSKLLMILLPPMHCLLAVHNHEHRKKIKINQMYHNKTHTHTHTQEIHVNKHFGRGELDELHLPGCRVSSISIRTEERLFGRGRGDNLPRLLDPSCSAKVEIDQKLRTYNDKDQVRYRKTKPNSGRGDIRDKRGNRPNHSPPRSERKVTNTQTHQGTNCPASLSSSSRPSPECLFNHRRLSPTPRSIHATRATSLQKQVKKRMNNGRHPRISGCHRADWLRLAENSATYHRAKE